MDELLFDENYIVFLQNQSLDTLCSLYLEVHNQLMDIIHTGTIMTKVMQEHGYSLDQYAYYKNDKMVA